MPAILWKCLVPLGPGAEHLIFQRILYVKHEYFKNQRDNIMKYTVFCGGGGIV